MFPLITAVTKLLSEFDNTVLIIAESPLSASVKTLLKSMDMFEVSSFTVISKIGFKIVGELSEAQSTGHVAAVSGVICPPVKQIPSPQYGAGQL